MKNFLNIAPNFSQIFSLFAFLFSTLACVGIDKGAKLEELKERSERILASLNGLEAKLQGIRSSETEPTPSPTFNDSLDEEVIWEDADSVPLPDDPKDSWLPKSEETSAAPGTETIEWDTQANDEKEQEQEEEIFREDEDFDFVIEKFEEDESFESGDDPFDGASNDYRFSSNDYYVIFNYGILMGSNIDFSSSSLGGISGEIETNAGNGMSLEFGFSFEMLELGILAGFTNQEFSNVSGEISNYYLALRPNMTFELSDSIDFRAGTSLGFSSRHNHLKTSGYVNDINGLTDSLKSNSLYIIDNSFALYPFDPNLYPTLDNPIFQEEKLCFLWDFHTTLQWALWDSGGLLFGYRLAIVTGTGNFDTHIANSFEFGGRWGF